MNRIIATKLQLVRFPFVQTHSPEVDCDGRPVTTATGTPTAPSQTNGDGTVTGHKCEQDYIVTAIKCEDDYCGRLTLRCNKLLNQGRWIQGSEYRTKQFSEEDGGEKRCLTGESALVGIECYSGYCDNKELICMKISNISW